MALIVEDGSGKSDAESYVSVSDCVSYAAARGLTFPAEPAANAEAALRRGTSWLDGAYRGSFPGRRKNGRAQALEWPRMDAWDNSRPPDPIRDDEIPVEIVHACCEAAIRELAAPGSLSPDVTPGQIEKRIKVEGIEIEYAIGAGTVAEQRPVVSIIDDILSSLIAIRRGAVLFGTAARS